MGRWIGEQLVGSQVGGWMGRQVGSQADRQLGGWVGRQISRQVGRQVDRQLGGWVGRQLGRQVARQAGQLGGQLGRQVGRQMDRYLHLDRWFYRTFIAFLQVTSPSEISNESSDDLENSTNVHTIIVDCSTFNFIDTQGVSTLIQVSSLVVGLL